MHDHVTMHIYVMQSACDYACMCMWLCTSMLCCQPVTMHAWACDYSYLCYSVSLWLCMHVHVILHIYAMQSSCNYACMSMWQCTLTLCSQLVTMHARACVYAHLCYVVSLWLCMHVHVFLHIYDMQSTCNHAYMSMWLRTFMLCSQLVTIHAWACDYAHLCYAVSLWLRMHVHVIMHIYAMQPACNYACMSMWLCTFTLFSQLVTMLACARVVPGNYLYLE